ncbi:transglutaminase domain-containing protein [Formosa algae]|uniref:transglutaminase domain-containing protein n=1 Tax=Formosa algae TaxID=225843 RepID=UPI000CCDECBB|nr:transglutaminase domain-containing protein [Formosa algae]PNW26243.1 hypothetical protein BKP44_17750 [Formosa algae]
MKNLLTNLLLFLSTLSLFAQAYNSKEFAISPNDLNINHYTKDSTANALVIYEYGKSYIDDNDFLLKTEYQKKVKILNRNGFEHATVEIQLYKNKTNKERITDIVATTFNSKNGAITSTRLNPSDIYYEDITPKHTLVKFTLPNIQEGSVITYSYKLSSPYIYKYHEWIFQEDIPKLYSEYITSIPGIYNYNIKLVGPYKFFDSNSKIKGNCLEGPGGSSADCGVTNYVMKDLPAFIEEDYMTSKRNYISRIDFELKTINHFDGSVEQITKTWKDVDHELKTDKEFGWQIRKSIKAEDFLSTEIIKNDNPLNKAQSIYNFVQDQYKWNGDYNDIFVETSVKDLINNKSGNASSINILLHNLLRDCNIEVKPVLLSTRNKGFATKVFPILSDFNYLIIQAKIGDDTYLLDAAEPELPFGSLPFRCLNGYGRLIDFKHGSEWIDIEEHKVSQIAYRVEMDIVNDSLQILSGITKTGYYAIDSKTDYLKDPELYKKEFSDEHPTLNVLEHTIKDSERNTLSFDEVFKLKQGLDPMNTTVNGVTKETLYINPILFPFIEKNPFTLQERLYPIDFGYKRTFSYILKLNTGKYTVAEAPKNAVFALPNKTGILKLNVNQQDDFIIINLKFSLDKPLYNHEYYESLKTLSSELINIQKNSIIVLNSI